MTEIINVLVGLLTPAIALVVAYIAMQQYKTNKLKLKFELFNKRFALYKEVLNLLDIVKTKGKPDITDIQRFHASVTEVDFLFGPEVRKYVDELCEHGGQLWAYQEKYRDCNQPEMKGYDHTKVVDAIINEGEWFFHQSSTNYKLAREKFNKYLNVNESGLS